MSNLKKPSLVGSDFWHCCGNKFLESQFGNTMNRVWTYISFIWTYVSFIYTLGLKFSAGSRGHDHQGLVLSAFPPIVSIAWDSRAHFILIIWPPDYLPCLRILIIWQTALVLVLNVTEASMMFQILRLSWLLRLAMHCKAAIKVTE